MGKRGPAPQGEYAGKSQVLSTRIRPDTRAALQEASKKSGRSLSQEIEHRLRRSFIEDEKIELAFGNRQNFSIMRTIAMALQLHGNWLTEPDGLPYWLTDAKIFDQTIRMINKVLVALRPIDAEVADISAAELDPVDDVMSVLESPNPDYSLLVEPLNHILSEVSAMDTWDMIDGSDPAQSILSGTIDDHRRAFLKSDLGPLLSRPNSLQEGDLISSKRRIAYYLRKLALEGLPDDQKERDDEG